MQVQLCKKTFPCAGVPVGNHLGIPHLVVSLLHIVDVVTTVLAWVLRERSLIKLLTQAHASELLDALLRPLRRLARDRVSNGADDESARDVERAEVLVA